MLARFASLGVALALALGAASAVHAQDDRERARAEFQRGVEAYGREDFQAALDAFQEAYRLAPHPAVRVNIANCYERLDRPVEALFHFEHFLSEAERPSAQQRREVQQAIRRLEQQVGRIQLQITPDGAIATIDGGETRRAPVLEPVRVTAGRHVVEIRLDGYASERQTVDVAGGQTVRVAVRLQRATVASAGTATDASVAAATSAGAPAATGATATAATTSTTTSTTTTTTTARADEPAPTTTTAAASSTRATSSASEESLEDSSGGGRGGFVLAVPTILAGAVTIGAGIGAAITGGLALAAGSEFDRNVAIYEDPASTPDARAQAQIDGEAAASDARTLATVTDVLLVTSIVGAGATVFFLITTQEGGMLADSGERETAGASGPRMVAVPIVTGGVAGAALVGTF